MKKKRYPRFLSILSIIPIIIVLTILWILFNSLPPRFNPIIGLNQKKASVDIANEFNDLHLSSFITDHQTLPFDACFDPVNFIFPRFPFRTHCVYKVTHIYSFSGDFEKLGSSLEEKLSQNGWERRNGSLSDFFKAVQDGKYASLVNKYNKGEFNLAFQPVKNVSKDKLFGLVMFEDHFFNFNENTYQERGIYRSPLYDKMKEEDYLEHIRGDYVIGVSIEKEYY